MKLKTILIPITCLLLSASSIAQWEATNASNTTNNVISDFCEHNSSLYLTGYEEIKKWDANASQWNDVPYSGFQVYSQEYIRHLVSTGDHLYATKWNPYCAGNLVYKSADDGLTFVLDTVGLPRTPVCDSLPSTILALFSLPNGKIVAEFGANYYTKYPNDAAWVIDNSNERFMAFGATAWYRMSSSALFKSTDDGQTWTTTAATNFPPGLQPSVLEVNSETGRIYMNAKYGFDNVSLYSDDEGTTWDTLHVNDVLGNSVFGIAQIVTAMIAKGDYIVFGAEQNTNGSHPEIYISLDGGQTFASDTVGLPSNAGIEDPTDLHFYNDQLFLVFGSHEIYRKDAVLSTANIAQMSKLTVYPNPTNGFIQLKSEADIKSAVLYDLQGSIVVGAQLDVSGEMDLSNVGSGVYLLKVEIGSHQEIHRIVKH